MISKSCSNCRWNIICNENIGRYAPYIDFDDNDSDAINSDCICENYELDILSDEYVDAYIEQKRNEFHEEYHEFYSWYRKSVGDGYINVRSQAI